MILTICSWIAVEYAITMKVSVGFVRKFYKIGEFIKLSQWKTKLNTPGTRVGPGDRDLTSSILVGFHFGHFHTRTRSGIIFWLIQPPTHHMDFKLLRTMNEVIEFGRKEGKAMSWSKVWPCSAQLVWCFKATSI